MGMQSKVIALLAAEDSPLATLLVRRADGQFALERIDARLGLALKLAAAYAPFPYRPMAEVFAKS
jgi:hypothetical protein